ncbi:Uncharacterized protein TCM_033161 [Theobroma cacao]|uniref:CCHC-type domain-containing protein n=1 Tax=Theobroma cacao TaxID=3641 RepID=A0A061FAV5_THECC|nr:Uncharacterized protein TCM_033161 [Theobroma cacao]
MTYDFFEMRDLITVAHQGDVKVDAKPCGVSIGIRGEECLSRPRDGCHGPDGEFRVLRCAGDTHTISRRDGSPDTSHSISEGSLDSTARSRWQPEPSSPKSAYSNNINVSIRGCGRNVREQPENDKEKVTVASKPLRKVSGVRYFPPGCGECCTGGESIVSGKRLHPRAEDRSISTPNTGDAKVDAKPCGVSIGIRGEECLSMPRGGCHGPDGEFWIGRPPRYEHPPLTRSVGRGRGRSQHRQLNPIEGESTASTIRAALVVEQTKTLRHPPLSPLSTSIPAMPPEAVQALTAFFIALAGQAQAGQAPPTDPPAAPSVPPPPPPSHHQCWMFLILISLKRLGNIVVFLVWSRDLRGLADLLWGPARCFHCGQPGHIRSDYPQLGRATTAAPSPPAHTDMQRRDSSRLPRRQG